MKNLATLSDTELRVYDAVKFSEMPLDFYTVSDYTGERLESVKETVSSLIGFGLLKMSNSLISIN